MWGKAVTVFLTSAVKFFLAPGSSVALGFGFWETVVLTTTGGISGFFFFFYAGKWVIIQLGKLRDRIWGPPEKKRYIKMNRRVRMYVRVKNRFGLFGLAFFTPWLLSIPIGTMLAARFFPNNRYTIPAFITSVVFWSFVLTFFSDILKRGVFS